MIDLNKVLLVGRLTRDAELKFSNSGTAVATLRVAWSRKYGDKDRKLFLDAVAFGKTAEWIEKWAGAKGAAIFLEGSLETQEWTTDSGDKRSAIKMIVDRAGFAESKRDAGDGRDERPREDDPPPARQERRERSAPPPANDRARDDLPF